MINSTKPTTFSKQRSFLTIFFQQLENPRPVFNATEFNATDFNATDFNATYFNATNFNATNIKGLLNQWVKSFSFLFSRLLSWGFKSWNLDNTKFNRIPWRKANSHPGWSRIYPTFLVNGKISPCV